MFLLWCNTLYSCKNFVLKRIKCYFNPELFVIDTVNWYKYVIGFCVVQFMIVGVEISILPCGTCSADLKLHVPVLNHTSQGSKLKKSSGRLLATNWRNVVARYKFLVASLYDVNEAAHSISLASDL